MIISHDGVFMNKANFGLIINYGSGLGQYVRKPFKIKAFIDRLFASNPFLCAKEKAPYAGRFFRGVKKVGWKPCVRLDKINLSMYNNGIRHRKRAVMNQERRNQIVKLINAQGTVSNEELIKRFGISIETVRRDLSFLEKKGAIERVYGGAVKKTFLSIEPSYEQRELKNAEEKIAIAEAAETFIDPNDTVFFDLGTSVLCLAQRVEREKQITAFTNALRTAVVLSEHGCRVVLPGGELRKGELSLSGSLTKENIEHFNFDKVFVGVAGVTKDGITDFIIDEANIRGEIIKNARQVIVLADHSKFGIRAMCKVCAIKDVDVLITDEQTPKSILKELKEQGVQIVIAKK